MATDTTKWAKKKERLTERQAQLQADLVTAREKVVNVERKLADVERGIAECDQIVTSGQVPA